MNKIKRKVNKVTTGIMVMLTLAISNVSIVFAKGEADISKSILFTGTKSLFSDLRKGLLGLTAVLVVTLCIYFGIRYKMADEQDQRMWKKRIGGTIVIGVLITVSTVVIPIILGYYSK